MSWQKKLCSAQLHFSCTGHMVKDSLDTHRFNNWSPTTDGHTKSTLAYLLSYPTPDGQNIHMDPMKSGLEHCVSCPTPKTPLPCTVDRSNPLLHPRSSLPAPFIPALFTVPANKEHEESMPPTVRCTSKAPQHLPRPSLRNYILPCLKVNRF